eukprot:Tbor_TRINITY_DN3299_c0_g1::TRINITY_DN3299_c0_g1_i1::g.23760::m.23760/K12399/AP3S; AP-3 complex subunit sigma
MIKAIIIINTSGKIRLLNFFENHIPLSSQQELVQKVFRTISKRGDNLCNFVDGFSEWPTADTRIVYRRYATLCFVFVVDSSESQLAILDLIQVFVEALDRTFESVCELDLIFHSDKVQHVLMEVVMAGMVTETNKDEVLKCQTEMSKLTSDAPIHGSKAVASSGYH